MNEDRNSIICIVIVIVLSIINIFSMYISKFIISIFTDYSMGSINPDLDITSLALNFTYLGLVGFVIYYFLVYKKNDNK